MKSNHGFIGREKELLIIDKLIQEYGKRRILFVSGRGGIGKTNLLRKLQETYRSKDSKIAMVGILDFDETSIRIPDNLTRELAEQLGRSEFEPYYFELDELVRMQAYQLGQETVKAQAAKVHDTFVSCFNKLAQKTRIVILFDTVEDIRKTYTWDYLVKLVPCLDNTLLILAGREMEVDRKFLLDKASVFNSRNVRYVCLQEFHRKDTETFFNIKNPAIPSNLKRKLQLLTNGHPILLSLAADWLRMKMSLPELLHMSLSEISNLDKEQAEILRGKFEKELIKSVLNLRKPLDQVMLLMAYIDRQFDEQILSYLSKLPIDESVRTINVLKEFDFIKLRPHGIALHDEMRRLIREHVWTSIDSMGTEREELSKQITIYYDELIQKIDDELMEWKVCYSNAVTQHDFVGQVNALREQDSKKRNLESINIDRLHYAWHAGAEVGYERFKKSFDIQDKQFRRMDYYRALLTETQNALSGDFGKIEASLTNKQLFEVQIDIARFYRWDKRTDEELKILKKLESDYSGNTVEQINFYSALAGYNNSEGNVPLALENAHKALRLSKKLKSDDSLARDSRAKMENLVGYCYRRMGRWDDAAEYYRLAIEHSNNILDRATALNNLSFLEGLRGDWFSGLVTCQEALRIREKHGTDRSIAASLYTLGSVYWAKEDFTKALDCYEKAYSKLSWPDDSERIAQIHFGKGIAYWFANKLEDARASFEECIRISKERGHNTDLPLATHDLGHIYWDLGDIDRAEALFREGYELSQRFHDYQALADTLAGFAELYYFLKRENEVISFVRELKEIQDQGFQFHLFAGRVERIQADIALDHGEYDKAIDLYCDGLVEIARHGGYGKYSLRHELLRLGSKMDKLPQELIRMWCDKLLVRWKKERLEIQRPEMASFCLARSY